MNLIGSEFYKVKSNGGLLLLLLLPALIAFIVFVYFYFVDKSFDGNFCYYFVFFLFRIYILIYPLIIAIGVFSFCNLERKNGGFFRLSCVPVSKVAIYLSKIFVLFGYLLLSFLFVYFVSLYGIKLFVENSSVLLMKSDLCFYGMNVFFVKSFCILLSIMMIQFVLSLLFDSLIICLGVNLFLVLVSGFLMKWNYAFLIVYGNVGLELYNGFLRGDNLILTNSFIVSIVYFFIFSFVGYFFFKKLK